MKKFLAFSLISSSLIFNIQQAKADWDYWGFKVEEETVNGFSGYFQNLYTINSNTGVGTLRKRFCGNDSCYNTTGFPLIRDRSDIAYPENHIDKDTFILREYETTNGSTVLYKKYNLNGDTLTNETITNNATYWFDDYSYTRIRGGESVDSDGNYYSDIGGKLWIKQDSNGTLSFGKIGNTTAVYSLSADGVTQNGTNLISRSSNGITSIGANSLKLQESGGLQKMWATDSSGASIPIDITNGSKLLIQGRDVEQSINNVGALSAALTGLPTVPHDTTLACGLGTGTHGGDFAFSGGCASKVNEKLSINYAASMTMPGQDYAGDFEDSFSARAGFVWKLGKSLKPTQISMGEKEKMEVKIDSLEDKNKKLENTVSTLIAKLERLEKIALSETKSKDLATIKLP